MHCAVGYSNGGGPTEGGAGALAESWDGSTWTAQVTPDPANSGMTYLDSISCLAADACTAAGYYEPLSGAAPILSLAETQDGRGRSRPPRTRRAP